MNSKLSTVCTLPGCRNPNQISSGEGHSRRYCSFHVEHHRRHGSYWYKSIPAGSLKPYIKSASEWLYRQLTGSETMDALLAVEALLSRAGEAVSAYSLSGKSAAEKAGIAFARLRDCKVDPRIILERSLAVAAFCKSQGIDNRQKEYRHVQMAKAVHRLASGTHKTTSGFALKPKFPRSEGNVLRHMGQALDDVLRFHFHQTPIEEIAQSALSMRVIERERHSEAHPASFASSVLSSPLMPPSVSSEYESEGEGEGVDRNTLHFDSWLSLPDIAGGKIIEPLLEQLLSVDVQRVRKPKADVLEKMRAMVSTILANFIKLSKTMPEGALLAVSMEHDAVNRYDRKGLGQLPKLLDLLCSAGLATKIKAEWRAKRTRFMPTEKLASLLLGLEVEPSDLLKVPGEETIRLTVRSPGRGKRGSRKPSVLCNYEDDTESNAMRDEMRIINRYLGQTPITLNGRPQAPFLLYRSFILRHPEDPVSFNLHGRLYGGFWLSLGKEERGGLMIDGEPIADLDYVSMFPRLAYVKAGLAPPEGDLYAIPGLENHRDGAKQALSALLSGQGEMKSLPRNSKDKLPKGWNAKKLQAAMISHHPHLTPFFGTDMGLDLMFTESQIMVKALLDLASQNVPALPMHDGMMVPESKAGLALKAMEDVALAVVGFKLPVAQKSLH